MLLVLAGCGGGSETSQSAFFGIGEGSTGTTKSGVTLRFADGNPPQQMFKGEEYNFAFIFENFQIHDVDDMVLRTGGYDSSLMQGLAEEYQISNLPRASEAIGPGVYSGLVVDGVRVDDFEGDFAFPAVFEYCYTAKTAMRENVCVPSSRNQCETDITKDSAQNGPVVVRIQNINALSDEIRVDFSLTTSGNGQVVNNCFETEDYANDYTINSVKLGSVEGSCTPAGTDDFLLGGGAGNFYCTFPRAGDSSYSSQVLVDIEYKFQQEQQLLLDVRDLDSPN